MELMTMYMKRIYVLGMAFSIGDKVNIGFVRSGLPCSLTGCLDYSDDADSIALCFPDKGTAYILISDIQSISPHDIEGLYRGQESVI